MTQTHTRPRRSWLRRVAIVAFALVLLVLLVRSGADVWASRRVSAQIAKLEAQHGPLDESTLRLPPVPEADNRGRAMRAAAALVVGHDEVRASRASFLAQREPTPLPADLQAFVERNRAALRVAEEARGRRQSNWEADYVARSNTVGLLEIRSLSVVLELAARSELDAGRIDAAASVLTTGLALSSSLRLEPSLVTQLIRCAVALQHFEGVEWLLTTSDPSEAALESLAAALAENRTPTPMHVGFIGELKTFHAALTRAANGEAAYPGITNPGHSSVWTRPFPWLGRPWVRLSHARYLEQLGRLLEAEMGPRPRPVSIEKPETWSFFMPSVAPGLERSMETGDLHHSALTMTELAVALRRYRLAHGEYPAALSALAPTYIESVPSDPLTGKLPAYTRQAGGFSLRSEHPKADEPATNAAALKWTVTR
jgi:hypothetical protein